MALQRNYLAARHFQQKNRRNSLVDVVYKTVALLIDAEYTRRIAAQKGGFGVIVEPEIAEPFKRHGGSYHGIVGSEHDLASAVAAHVLHQLRRIASDRIGRDVDVDIFAFGGVISAVQG